MTDASERIAALEALPVGSVILDLGEIDAPVTACKALRGDWQVLGDDPDRRWWSFEIIEGAGDQPLTVAHRPDRLPERETI